MNINEILKSLQNTNNLSSSGINALSSLGSSLISGGFNTGAGSLMKGIGGLASNIPGPLGAIAGAGLNIAGGLVDRAFGSKLNEENIDLINQGINRMNNFNSNASSFDSLINLSNTAPSISGFSNNFIGKDGWFSNKAKNKANSLRQEQDLASLFVDKSLNNNLNNLKTTQAVNLLANYAAFGGNVKTINNGGTHEENIFGGVPMGISPNGNINLVEEDEVIWNDYAFSNRIKLPKELKNKLKLRGNTFAEAAKNVQKESKERPNDSISKKGLDSVMAILMNTQEELKQLQLMNQNNKSNIYKDGGFIKGKSTMLDHVLPTFNTINPNFNNIQPIQQFPINSNIYKDNNSSRGIFETANLRYAPAIGAGIMALTDTLGLTNKPNYKDSDRLLEAASSLNPINGKPIGNYMRYTPLDRLFYMNQLNANAGSNRRGILNNSYGNRGLATANLLASDYNTINSIGKLAREAEEYNLNQRERVEGFNRETDRYNSDLDYRVNAFNSELQKSKLGILGSALDMRQKERLASAQARGANLTNFLDSIGNIGREEFTKNMIRTSPHLYYTQDSLGNIIYKDAYYNLSNRDKELLNSTIKKGN